ncbi:aminotransferase [Leifsonia sp. A12D58]|uniref:aminotransferase n=1 Tax=Leifsonia sp. A12D58 TaxID=3397674 RepID=UPI0039E16A4F
MAFDFFDGVQLIRPAVTEADAVVAAAQLFGISGTAREMGSQQDRNYRIDPGDGIRYLLKFDNAAFTPGELAVQDAALSHVSARGVVVPVPVVGLDGRTRQQWALGGTSLPVRMFTYVEGPPLAERGHLDHVAITALGALSGTLARELADLPHDNLDRILQWDMRQAARVIDQLISHVPDEAKRARVRELSDSAADRLASVQPALRVQPIHGDITDDNVICAVRDDERYTPIGVIDFGDLALGWLVAELAVTVSSVLPHVPRNPWAVLDAIAAFDAVVPLSNAEISALWPLVVLRGAVLVVSGEHQVQIDSGNDYAEERMSGEWDVFALASAIGWDEAESAIRRRLGREPLFPQSAGTSAGVQSGSLITGVAPDFTVPDVTVLDFTVTSPDLADGLWQQPDIEWTLARAALTRCGAAVAVAPYGQRRLTRTRVHSRDEQATVALVTEFFVLPGRGIVSPITAQVAAVESDGVLLVAPGTVLRVRGFLPELRAGESVSTGQHLGTAQPSLDDPAPDATRLGRIRVQRLASAHLDPPEFVSEARSIGWLDLAIDPASLLGLAPYVSPFDPARESERRAAVFAAAQERYYENPPEIERGWQEFLVDTTGKAYVDLVNNVSGIGHSHPRFTAAVTSQLRLLNTNSRFLYRALADLSERLVELAPDPSLDTVLLVNSGSEAVDLALRLAQIHTGRRSIVALRESYHGWTMASDAVSTSAYDNPFALSNRPDWVQIADVPNVYRGVHRGPDAAAAYLADLTRQLDELAETDTEIAGFICEPVLGNAGGVLLPDGYLAGVYEDIRRRGGLCISDEVQVGYGRLGEYFWGADQQGVVPDIITIAKMMGNAYPLGAVITRREIAESLAREGTFFSSAGGTPVSCVAGIAVLDVIRDDGLQQNAHLVGAHLVGRLEELATRHPLIGAVHGLGLYLGIELVRDRATREPATAETAAICERMRELGVIVQPTSERQNVLKVKPPLCLSIESADFIVDALDEVLSQGW